MTDYTKSTNFATKDSLPPGSALKIVRGTEIDTEFNAIATAVATKADLASPALTGTPTAPTPTGTDNSTKIATTAFVNTLATGFGFKNRIINGAMVIDQRNAGASVTVTPANSLVMDTDRWFGFGAQASKFSLQQNAAAVTPPAGFTKYLGVTSLSAYSVGASDVFLIGQRIEGFNIADLAFGTASAASVTVSFWVRSSLTGTFGGALGNSSSRTYPFTYTINAANTWEQKVVTIAGDTSGSWASDNSTGFQLTFGLGAGASASATAGSWQASAAGTATGATSVVGTSGATFYITGVQLEKGSTATSFDYRPYGTELALCQRYFEKSFVQATAPAQNAGRGNASTFPQVVGASTIQYCIGLTRYAVTKRTNPVVILYNPSAANAAVRNPNTASDWTSSGVETAESNESVLVISGTSPAGSSAGHFCEIHWTASAEL